MNYSMGLPLSAEEQARLSAMQNAQNMGADAMSPITTSSYKGISAQPSGAAMLAKALQGYGAGRGIKAAKAGGPQEFDKNSVFAKPTIGDFAQHPMQSLSNLFR